MKIEEKEFYVLTMEPEEHKGLYDFIVIFSKKIPKSELTEAKKEELLKFTTKFIEDHNEYYKKKRDNE